jgi:hypothetical protein
VIPLAFILAVTHLAADVPMHQQVLLVFGVGLIGFWFVMKMNRRKAQSGEAVLTPEEQIERLRQSKGMQGDLETLMVEIEDLAKRVGKQLDAKSAEVERLLAEADRRIAELKRLQGEEGAGRPPLRLSSASTPGAALPEDPLARSVYALADAGHAPPDIARRLNEPIGKVELVLALRKA